MDTKTLEGTCHVAARFEKITTNFEEFRASELAAFMGYMLDSFRQGHPGVTPAVKLSDWVLVPEHTEREYDPDTGKEFDPPQVRLVPEMYVRQITMRCPDAT